MQNIGPRISTLGTVYSAAQVLAILQAPVAVESTIFERVDGLGLTSMGDITSYVGRSRAPFSEGGQSLSAATVQHDSSRTVPETLTLSIRQDANLDWYNDFIRVWKRFLAPDGGWIEFRRGVFVPVAPNKSITDIGGWFTLTMADMTQLLNDSVLEAPTTVHAGAFYLDEAVAIAKSVIPYLRYVSTPSSVPLQADLSWSAGTSRLQQVNELLAAIGYNSLWFDENGFARFEPLSDFSEAISSFLIDLVQASTSVMSADISENADTTGAFNACIFTVANSQLPAMSAYYENDSPLSPISTVNFRMKKQIIEDSSVNDVATAITRAKSVVQESSRVFSPLTMASISWPFSQHLDVFQVGYTNPDDGVVLNTFLETAWDMDLEPGGLTTHTLERITPGV